MANASFFALNDLKGTINQEDTVHILGSGDVPSGTASLFTILVK